MSVDWITSIDWWLVGVAVATTYWAVWIYRSWTADTGGEKIVALLHEVLAIALLCLFVLHATFDSVMMGVDANQTALLAALEGVCR